MKKFVTYSQELEDWILYCALMGVEKGFYVDVGANDPFDLSVTKAFYDMGWNGVNIEPLKDKYNELCAERPRDINLNIGVGSSNGQLVFYISGVGTTCDESVARKWRDFDKVKRDEIPVMKLSDVLMEHVKDKDQVIHFCKIDVEGFERSVLEGMDFSVYRPWIMVMEATLPGTGIPCHEQWEDLLLGNGYEMVFTHGINRYYADGSDKKRIDIIRKNLDNINSFRAQYHFYKCVGLGDASNISTVIYTRVYEIFKCCAYMILSAVCPIKSFKNKASKYERRLRDSLHQ